MEHAQLQEISYRYKFTAVVDRNILSYTFKFLP